MTPLDKILAAVAATLTYLVSIDAIDPGLSNAVSALVAAALTLAAALGIRSLRRRV